MNIQGYFVAVHNGKAYWHLFLTKQNLLSEMPQQHLK